MKAKTINKVLRTKINDWVNSIEDEELKGRVKENVIVTGGAIASMLLKEPVNDYDVYFRSGDVAEAVAKYYLGRFNPRDKKGIPCKMYVDRTEDRVCIVIKSAGIASEGGTTKEYEYFEASPEDRAGEYVSDVMQDAGEIEDVVEETKEALVDAGPKYRPVFVSSNAITLSGKIQIVLRFFGEPEDIHKNYDYVHCTNYWSSWNNTLTLKQDALEALLSRELRYVGSKYPICSLIRMRKFIKRGWSINAGQILKMVFQCSELNLKDYSVLQDQLTGVDVAYFAEVLAKIKADDPEKINSAYLIEIIDRML